MDWKEILLIDEIKREVIKNLKEEKQKTTPSENEKRKKTTIRRFKNILVRKYYEVLKIENKVGKLIESTLITNTKNYGIELYIDNLPVFRIESDELKDIYEFIGDISFLKKKNNYILRIRNIYFEKYFKFAIFNLTEKEITFSSIYYKYYEQ